MKKKKPVSITLDDKDKCKVDSLAAAAGTSRSDMIRSLIRSKRKPKKFRRPTFLSPNERRWRADQHREESAAEANRPGNILRPFIPLPLDEPIDADRKKKNNSGGAE